MDDSISSFIKATLANKPCKLLKKSLLLQFNLGLIGNAVHEYQATYISSWQLIRCFIRKMQGHGMSSTSENK